MQDSYTNKRTEFDGEIDLRDLFNVLLQGRRIIISITAFVSIIAVIYSLLLPNIYESKALLAPVKTSSINGALKNYSNLAGLAGINLPSDDNEGNVQEAIEKIRSLSFFENNLLKNIYLPDLMAVKSWDAKTKTLTYDKNIYDAKNSIWIRDYSYPQQQIPSAQESYEEFTEEYLNLSEDKKSGFITLSIKHQSPYLAKQWVELIVDEVNNFYRQKDKLESEKAIYYLTQQISSTSFSEIKEALAKIVQEETKKLAVVEANQFYVFEYIDPPALMEKKSEPKRVLISILGILLGSILGSIIALTSHYIFRKKAS